MSPQPHLDNAVLSMLGFTGDTSADHSPANEVELECSHSGVVADLKANNSVASPICKQGQSDANRSRNPNAGLPPEDQGIDTDTDANDEVMDLQDTPGATHRTRCSLRKKGREAVRKMRAIIKEECRPLTGEERAEHAHSLRDRQAGKQDIKKKVGRPITYKGDINSTRLTEDERRRIKRRVANRESARRVRLKRQEQHQELEVQIRQLAEHNKRLMAHAAESERGRSVYAAQMQTYKASWSQAAAENLRLQGELASMRRSLEIAVTGNACFITAQWADGLAAQAVSCSNEASAWDPQPLGGTAGSAPAMLGLSSLPLGLAPQSPLSTLSNFNSSASSNDMYPLPAACSEAFSLGQITSGIFTSTWM